MPIDIFSSRVGELLSEQEKEREWQLGFEAMGSDPNVNDVEYMLFAAQEVFLADENNFPRLTDESNLC